MVPPGRRHKPVEIVALRIGPPVNVMKSHPITGVARVDAASTAIAGENRVADPGG